MNKKVLVTGASKGIGKSIANALIGAGYEVYICARNFELVQNTAKEIGAKGFFACDVTDYSACNEMLTKIGGIDILVNNAGGYVWSAVENVSQEDVNFLIDLNVKAPYNIISLCVKEMKQKKWGRIINIGSISGVVGEANASLYSMTKSAMTGLTKALGLELAEYGITINTINPGWVKTDLADNAVEDGDFSEEEIKDMIPQRRFISPDEIADLVKYLASDEAKGMTAQNISLCAGLSAG